MYEVPEIDLVIKKKEAVEKEKLLSLPKKYILIENLLLEEELEIFTSDNGIPAYTAKNKTYLKDINLTVKNILKANILNIKLFLVEEEIKYDLLDTNILIRFLEIPLPAINNESLQFSQSKINEEIPDLEETEIFSESYNEYIANEAENKEIADLDFEWE